MIDFIDIQRLGFKKESAHDPVYENQYGRPYWYMAFYAKIVCKGYTNEIVFEWDCDTRKVKVFRNEKFVVEFEKFEDFIKFFSVFERENS